MLCGVPHNWTAGESALVYSISAVLPAFNEEKNISNCVNSIAKTLDCLDLSQWEIIVVDDGSVDTTYDIIQSEFGDEVRVRCVRHDKNLGYGAALCSGLHNAKLDWIFITDSDMQFFPEEIDKLLRHTEDFNFVQGVRAERADPIGRIILGRVYRAIVHFFFKMPVADPECSFRLVKRDLVAEMNFVCTGPMVPVELVYKANIAGASFIDVPVSHRERQYGETNALTFRSLARIAVDFSRLIRVLV